MDMPSMYGETVMTQRYPDVVKVTFSTGINIRNALHIPGTLIADDNGYGTHVRFRAEKFERYFLRTFIINYVMGLMPNRAEYLEFN